MPKKKARKRTEQKAPAPAAQAKDGSSSEGEAAPASLLQTKIAELERTSVQKAEADKLVRQNVKKQAKELKKSLESLETPAERFQALHAQHMTLLMQNKTMERELSLAKSRVETLSQEKQRTRTDLTKEKQSRMRLEELCRELQKRNKVVSDTAEKRHNQLSDEFQGTLKKFTSKMADDGDERLQQVKDTEIAKARLENFMEQYDVREKHFVTQLKAKELELKLADAKLAQAVDIATRVSQEKMKVDAEAQLALYKEKETRMQLDVYKEKFGEFENMMTQSHDVLQSFKQELDKSMKKNVELEHQNQVLKTKDARSNLKIIEFTKALQEQADEIKNITARKEKLESLCRALSGKEPPKEKEEEEAEEAEDAEEKDAEEKAEKEAEA